MKKVLKPRDLLTPSMCAQRESDQKGDEGIYSTSDGSCFFVQIAAPGLGVRVFARQTFYHAWLYDSNWLPWFVHLYVEIIYELQRLDYLTYGWTTMV